MGVGRVEGGVGDGGGIRKEISKLCGQKECIKVATIYRYCVCISMFRFLKSNFGQASVLSIPQEVPYNHCASDLIVRISGRESISMNKRTHFRLKILLQRRTFPIRIYMS